MALCRLLARSRSLLFVTALSASTWTADAYGDEITKLQCIEANETGSKLRLQQHFEHARSHFAKCAVEECPQLVREDCTTQLHAVNLGIPTIRIVEQDAGGARISGAELRVDGVVRLSDETFALDPGDHEVAISASGFKPAVRTIHLQPGVKGHVEVVVLDPKAGEPLRPEASLPSKKTIAATSSLLGENQRTVAIVVGGSGLVAAAVGSYFGLHAKSTYNDALANGCPIGPSACNLQGVQGVESAHTQAAVSTIAFTLTAALLTGAVALLITAPRASDKALEE